MRVLVCKGTGQIKYDMAFAEPVIIPCEECGGHRYNPTALSYPYKGMNIEEIMSLTIEHGHLQRDAFCVSFFMLTTNHFQLLEIRLDREVVFMRFMHK